MSSFWTEILISGLAFFVLALVILRVRSLERAFDNGVEKEASVTEDFGDFRILWPKLGAEFDPLHLEFPPSEAGLPIVRSAWAIPMRDRPSDLRPAPHKKTTGKNDG